MMDAPYLISICIPTYKRIVDLEKLLDSIGRQSFKNFEVIITDDSPDDTVKNFAANYPADFKLLYFKNSTALGTPENWNEGIRKANGQWVKLMHDDDYFATEDSLAAYVQAMDAHPSAKVFYSAFIFENMAQQSRQLITCNWFDRFFLGLSPLHLLKRNYFGNPSCVLVKKELPFLYDNRFKYIVDFAYYIELLQNKVPAVYLPKVLIHVGQNEEQVTHYTFKNVAVQMYENHILFEKLGAKALNNVVAYDYFWRNYRNFSITAAEQILPHYGGEIALPLQRMLSAQKAIPRIFLKTGLSSKFFMLWSYCIMRLS